MMDEKSAMVRVMRDKVLRKLGFRTALQVHDELVLRGPLCNLEDAKPRLEMHMRATFEWYKEQA